MDRVGMNGAALTSELQSVREELPVELDFVLPDDCPDIAKVLRGCFRLGQNSASRTDGGITVEGNVCADVWYIADSGGVCRVSGRTAFSKRLACEPGNGTAPAVTGVCTYCTARAVNQRRVECKGAMLLRAEYTVSASQPYMASCGRDDVECMTESFSALCPTGHFFARIGFEEERVLPEETPDPTAVLRFEGEPVITDRRQVDGRLMVKGELRTAVCCTREEGTPFLIRMSLPFSRLIEADGICPDTVCDLRCEPCWLDAELRANEAGRKRTLVLRGEALLTASVHQSEELTAVTDAFGLRCAAEPVPTRLNLPDRTGSVRASVRYEQVCDPPVAGVSEVLDAWGTASARSPRRTESGLEIPVRLTVRVLVLDGNGRPALLERTDEVAAAVETDAGEPFVMGCSVRISELKAVPDENGVRCTAEVTASGCLYSRTLRPVLEGVDLNPDEPLAAPPSPLTLLWADGEDSVWALAKKYAVPVSALHPQDGFALVERA